MARYCGMIGYATSEPEYYIDEKTGKQKKTGRYVDAIEERRYFGDVLNMGSRWTAADTVNDDYTVTNKISVVADGFANTHFHCIKYAEYLGALWKVTNIEVEPPRLLLTLGGVYNGDEA